MPEHIRITIYLPGLFVSFVFGESVAVPEAVAEAEAEVTGLTVPDTEFPPVPEAPPVPAVPPVPEVALALALGLGLADAPAFVPPPPAFGCEFEGEGVSSAYKVDITANGLKLST